MLAEACPHAVVREKPVCMTLSLCHSVSVFPTYVPVGQQELAGTFLSGLMLITVWWCIRTTLIVCAFLPHDDLVLKPRRTESLSR